MKDLKDYYLIAIFLLFASFVRTIFLANKKEVRTTLNVISSFLVSILGGMMAGLVAEVYIGNSSIVFVVVGSAAWQGEHALNFIWDYVEEHILKIKKDDRKKEE